MMIGSQSPDSSIFLSKYSLVVPSAIAALTSQRTTKPLDPGFQPGKYDVVCGRGKGSYNRPGNVHFRSLITAYIPQYMRSKSKIDKTTILSSIVDEVRSFRNPETGRSADFVKYTKSAGWSTIGDEQAREKVGHAIREAITTKDNQENNTKKKVPKLAPSTRTRALQTALPAKHFNPIERFCVEYQSNIDVYPKRSSLLLLQRPSLTSEMKSALDYLIDLYGTFPE